MRRLANEFDLVVTTYQTLGTDFSRGNNPLAGLDWHRVVLDEAHSIKEIKSNQSKACCALTSNFRWCCTGGLSQPPTSYIATQPLDTHERIADRGSRH